MKLKKQLYKIISASFIYIAAIVIRDNQWVSLALYAAAYFLVGTEIIRKAFRNLFRGNALDENFLMMIATFGAFALRQYSEGVAVMLFYQIGELFQSYAVNKSRKSVSALMNIRPDYANLKTADGIQKVSPEEVCPGQVIIIKSGEKIPLDGIVVSGHSLVDTSAVTGEAVPREILEGGEVISGCVNVSGLLEVKVTKEYGESTVAKILDLVENAGSKKAEAEKFITRFARYYTPAVVLAAVAIAVLPPLLINGAVFGEWFYRSLTFLVISCPCALVISVPLSFFGGIGAASRHGILVKGGNYLQALADAEIVVFDKTGTLTKGSFSVVEIKAENVSEDELVCLAASAGIYSSHPVSVSIRNQAKGKIPLDAKQVSGFEEIPGKGIKADVSGKEVYVGNAKLMESLQIKWHEAPAGGTVVYVAADKSCLGWIRIDDEIKEDAVQAVADLKKLGVKKVVMLTGDTCSAGEKAAVKIGVDKVYAELLPAQKVEKVEELLLQKSPEGKLVFAGDGINDAPVLARADIGIAMGGVGADAAVEAADVVIMTDEPSLIGTAVRISKKTLKIVKQNIVFALGVKFIVLGLGVAGMATMWEAVFADVGVSVLAILNAMRALQYKR